MEFVSSTINNSELGILGNDVWSEFHSLGHVALDLHLALSYD
jgi:hypothetical protein